MDNCSLNWIEDTHCPQVDRNDGLPRDQHAKHWNGEAPIPWKQTVPSRTEPDKGDNCNPTFRIVSPPAPAPTINTAVATTDEVKKPTYPQDWTPYNRAQQDELENLQKLLHQLCQTIEQPVQKMGRPRLSLAEAVFCAVMKVYSQKGGRKATGFWKLAFKSGYISRVPHFNTVSKYLDKPEVTPILEEAILRSSLPFQDVDEQVFIADATGFTASPYRRWREVKKKLEKERKAKEKAEKEAAKAEKEAAKAEKEAAKTGNENVSQTKKEEEGNEEREVNKKRRKWVKLHIMCGKKTNVVTAVMIRDKAHESKMFEDLLRQTAQNFKMREVAADKAYLKVTHLETVASYGAEPYIMFKSNSKDRQKSYWWKKMYHMFKSEEEEYMKHYHQRSNVEATFSMMKRNYGSAVRSTSDTAMLNEVLCKIICHNLCCLNVEMYVLGIEAKFLRDGEARPQLTVVSEATAAG
jgi:hypothetical protein